MGETLDYINSCIENGECDSAGEMFNGCDTVTGYECSACHREFETEGHARYHVIRKRALETRKRFPAKHKRATIHENHMTDGPDYYYAISVPRKKN